MNSFYVFQYPKNINFEIIFNNNQLKQNKNFTKNNLIIQHFFKKYNYQNNKLNLLKNKYKNNKSISYYKKDLFAIEDLCLRIYYQPYFNRLFFNFKDSAVLLTKDINKTIEKSYLLKKIETFFKYSNKIHNSDTNEKFNHLYYTMSSDKLYKKLKDKKYCERVNIIFESQLKVLYQIYKFLNINGILYIGFMGGICDNYIIECIYLLSLMFESIIINPNNHFTCIGFLGEKNISKDLFKKIIKNSKNFNIQPKPELSNILKYFLINKIYYYKLQKNLILNKFDKYKLELFKDTLLNIYQVSPDSYYINNIIQNFIEYFQLKKNNIFISELFNNYDKIKINKLFSIIKSSKFKFKNNNILQIGCSYGSLSYNLIKQKKNIKLTILDPYQEEKFDNYGLDFLEYKKINKNKYNLLQSNIIDNLNNFILEQKKFSLIILSIDQNFQELTSYLVYLNNLLEKNGFLFINSFNTEYIQLIDFMKNNLNIYKNVYQIEHNYYLFQI